MRRIALLIALALAVPMAAEAQTRLVLGAGLSRPTGDMADGLDMGQHARVGLQVGVPVFPVSVRAEGGYHRFPPSGGGDNTSMLTGTLSAVLTLGGIGLSPYVLGGMGSYRVSEPLLEAETSRGIHGGFGVALGALGAGAFAELRIVRISPDVGGNQIYVPVTVGLRF